MMPRVLEAGSIGSEPIQAFAVGYQGQGNGLSRRRLVSRKHWHREQFHSNGGSRSTPLVLFVSSTCRSFLWIRATTMMVEERDEGGGNQELLSEGWKSQVLEKATEVLEALGTARMKL